MKKRSIAVACTLSLSAGTAVAGGGSEVPSLDHVFVIVL
jgi:hypothetical protein